MRRLSSHGARPIATNRRSIPRACAPRRVLATIPDQERTRCFALPVLQDRWAFYPDIHHAHSGDLFGGTSNTFKGRLGKIYERSRKEWEECVHAPPGTIRHRIFKFSLKLQSRIDPREILARSLVPPPAVLVANPQTRVPSTLVTVLYPAGCSEHTVEQAYTVAMLDRVSVHRTRMLGCIALIPVSLACGILPGPNVFLAWNLIRLWAHYRAEKGARAGLAGAFGLELLPSEEVENFAQIRTRSEASDETFQRLEQHFDLPDFLGYMQRTRMRLLKERPTKRR